MDATDKISSAWQRSVRGLSRRLGFDGPVTYAVRVDSPASRDAVLEVLDWVDAHSPLTNILRKPVELRRELHLAHADG